MEKESCSHSEKGGKAMPQEAEQKGEESGRQGQMNMGLSGGYPNQPSSPDMQQSGPQGAGNGQQMNMGPSGGYPNQPPYPDMQQNVQQGAGNGRHGQMNMGGASGGYQPSHPGMPQSSHKCSDSSHSGQMNMGASGGYPNQPPYSDMQQNFQQSGGYQEQMNMGYYPNQSSHSGMKGGHSKPSHHCSCSGQQQQYGPGHVSEMMGRFMSGNVTTDDMGAIGSFFGIDCQSTRFWTGIALGAVGALILTKAFKS